MEYTVIKVSELAAYTHSEAYANMPQVPISSIRALSHANNPHADPDDPALILAIENEMMAGYLGMMSSQYKGASGFQKAFFLSCMWVSDNFRGRGIAKTLMQKGFEACSGKVFITNYYPPSKAVFDATGQYNQLIHLEGIRGYFRFDLAGILTRRFKLLKPFRGMFKQMDDVLNLVNRLRIKRYQRVIGQGLDYQPVSCIDDAELKPLLPIMEQSLFHSDFQHLKWVSGYPWISEVPLPESELKRYFFSQWRTQFKTRLLLLSTTDQKPVGLLMLVITLNELKTPYLIYHDGYAANVARILIAEMIANGVATLVCHHAATVSELKKLKPFWYQRESRHGFLVSNEIHSDIDISKTIYDGDGDGAFT